MKQVKISNKIQTILSSLESSEEETVLKGLKELRANGNEMVVLPILNIWNKGVSQKVEKEIISLLQDVKKFDIAPTIMQAINNKEFQNIRIPLLNVVWNSEVDYSGYLPDFVRLAVENDFLTAFECLTIIENLQGPFDETLLLDTKILLQKFVAKNRETELSEKQMLVAEILNLLMAFERNEKN